MFDHRVNLNLLNPSTNLYLDIDPNSKRNKENNNNENNNKENNEDSSYEIDMRDRDLALYVNHGKRELKIDSVQNPTPIIYLDEPAINVSFVKERPLIQSDRYCISSNPEIKCSDFAEYERGTKEDFLKRFDHSIYSIVFLTENIELDLNPNKFFQFIGKPNNNEKIILTINSSELISINSLSISNLQVELKGSFKFYVAEIIDSTIIASKSLSFISLIIQNSTIISEKEPIEAEKLKVDYLSSIDCNLLQINEDAKPTFKYYGECQKCSISISNISVEVRHNNKKNSKQSIITIRTNSSLMSSKRQFSNQPSLSFYNISEYDIIAPKNLSSSHFPIIELYINNQGAKIVSRSVNTINFDSNNNNAYFTDYNVNDYYQSQNDFGTIYIKTNDEFENSFIYYYLDIGYDYDWTMIPLQIEANTQFNFDFVPELFNLTIKNIETLSHINKGEYGFESLTLYADDQINEIIFDRNSVILSYSINNVNHLREIIYELHLIIEKSSHIKFSLNGDTRGIFSHFTSDFLSDTTLSFYGSWWNIPAQESGKIIINHKGKLIFSEESLISNEKSGIPRMQIYPPTRNVIYPSFYELNADSIPSNQFCIYFSEESKKDCIERLKFRDMTPIDSKNINNYIEKNIYPTMTFKFSQPGNLIQVNLQKFIGTSLTFIGYSNEQNWIAFTPGHHDIDLTLENIVLQSQVPDLDFKRLYLTRSNLTFNNQYSINIIAVNLKVDSESMFDYHLKIIVYSSATIFGYSNFNTLLLGPDSIAIPNGGQIFKGVSETTIQFFSQSLVMTLDTLPNAKSILNGFSIWISNEDRKESTVKLSKSLINMDSHRRITIYHPSVDLVIQADSERFPLVGVVPQTNVIYSLKDVVFVPKKKQSSLVFVEIALLACLMIFVIYKTGSYRKLLPNPTFERSSSDEAIRIDVEDDEDNKKPEEEDQNKANELQV